MSIEMFVDLENVMVESLMDLRALGDEFGGTEKITLYHPYTGDALWQEARLVGATVVQPPSRNGKSSTDMVLACDLIEAGLYSRAEWIGLVSGDRDFLPALTLIRRRKPERCLAVFASEKGFSPDLQNALGPVIDRFEFLPSVQPRPDLAPLLLELMIGVKPPGGYWTQSLLITYALDPRNNLMPNNELEVVEAIRHLRRDGILNMERREIEGVGKRRVLEIA